MAQSVTTNMQMCPLLTFYLFEPIPSKNRKNNDLLCFSPQFEINCYPHIAIHSPAHMQGISIAVLLSEQGVLPSTARRSKPLRISFVRITRSISNFQLRDSVENRGGNSLFLDGKELGRHEWRANASIHRRRFTTERACACHPAMRTFAIRIN